MLFYMCPYPSKPKENAFKPCIRCTKAYVLMVTKLMSLRENRKDIYFNHKEKSIRRNHKGCIVYTYAKTLGQITSLKYMSLCIVSLLMVEVYVLMLFLHEEGASPL